MPGPGDLRLQLRKNGYDPLLLFGKRPALDEWQKRTGTSEGDIEIWSKLYPDARNTGVLTQTVPALDIDILDPTAAEAAESAAREKFEEHGDIHVRFGKWPKRCVFFRTEEPFAKFAVSLIAPNGDTSQKIEFLARGQQAVVDGVHPDTGKPYTWFGGTLCDAPQESLPYIREAEARALVEAIVETLVNEHGYQRAQQRPRPRGRNGGDAGSGADDWLHLIENIRAGRDLHDSLRDLAAKLIRSGTNAGAAVNQLRALMQSAQMPHDQRWKLRFSEIPHLVSKAPTRSFANPTLSSSMRHRTRSTRLSPCSTVG